MLSEMIVNSAWGSFTQVTVFVGALLLFFGWINHKTDGGFVRAIERNVKWQPLIGAALGTTPGCGGAIFIMPLYVRGVCSYGTAIATLISTMGDSAFVVIAKSPLAALWINAISFVTAVVTGYAVDWLGIGKNLVAHAAADGEAEGEVSEGRFERALHPPDHENPDSFGYRVTHGLHWLFWGVMGVGAVIGVLLLFQIDHTKMGTIAGLSIPQIIGVAGTLLCAVWMFMAKHFLSDDTYGESEEKLESMKETFIHNAHETAFVGFWVFIAYMAYEVGIWGIGGETKLEQLIAAAGVVPVIISALVGLIPGCGPQVVLVTLYCQGIVPFPAVVANAISQDGDALIPLIAMHPKSSLYATVITTIPALIVGVALYYIM